MPEYQTIIHRVEGASALWGFQGGGSGSFDFTSRNKALQKTMLQEEACESDESEDDIPVSERLKAMRRQKAMPSCTRSQTPQRFWQRQARRLRS